MATEHSFTQRELQGNLYQFFHRFGLPWLAPKRDGVPGPQTARAVRKAKLCLGYAPGSRAFKANQYKADKLFYNRLHRPFYRVWVTPRMIKRGLAYRRYLKRTHAAAGQRVTLSNRTYTGMNGMRWTLAPYQIDGAVWFDHQPVASWMVPQLKRCRERGWGGHVSLGIRSYSHQWNIYFVQHIRPAAYPGSSNHEKDNYPGGAVDATAPYQLAQVNRNIGRGNPPFYHANEVGFDDPPHFSRSGY